MAFRRRPQLPEWRKRQLRQEEAKKDAEHNEKIAAIFDFSEEEIEKMKQCICPRANCPIHPSESPEGEN